MARALVTLEGVESFIAQPRKSGIVFAPEIELQFQEDTHARRCERRVVGILVSATIYNLFLIADWLLVPDVWWTAVSLHFAVVTPWMLIAAWLISRRPSPFVCESLATSVPLLIILQIDIGLALTTSATAAHYQYVVIPTLLYTNVSLHRLTFPYACLATAGVLLCHGSLILTAGGLTGVVIAMIFVQIVVCAYITLVANYSMERDLRRAYVYTLRERLRHAQAEVASKRDALTGLSNRRHLDDELSKLWATQIKHEQIVSIIVADIDHFKHLNDRYGHCAGDLCLKRIGGILTGELRGDADRAIRYGGEEFLVLLPNIRMVDALQIAERIRQAVEDAGIPNESAGSRGVVTASLGVATASVAELSAADLVAAADSALYAAKRNGRNQVWPRTTRPNEAAFPPIDSTSAALLVSNCAA